MNEVENIIPVFPVKNIKAAKNFYLSQLGFRLDWDAGMICSISRDAHCLMLSEGTEARSPAMAWIGLETDALMRHAIKNRLVIHQEARNDDFAYHMKIKDIDGNILWLGTEKKQSEQDRGADGLPRAPHD